MFTKKIIVHISGWKAICFLVIFIYSLIIVFSQKNGPVISGDSLQYLSMANKISSCQIPYSDKWLQFYPILISLFNLIFKDLIYSACFTNLIILSVFIVVLNKLIYNIFRNLKIVIFLDAVILSDRELYFHSMTIMAELLFITLLAIFFLMVAAIVRRNNLNDYDILRLMSLSIILFFSKYNAIVVYILAFIVIGVYSSKKALHFLFYFFSLIVVKLTHSCVFKPESVYLINFNKVYNISFNALLEGLHQGISVLLEYLISPGFALEYSKFNCLISLLIIFILLTLTARYFRIKGIKNNISFLFLFVWIYFFVFILVAKSTRLGQIDLRQFFYVGFSINILAFFFIYLSKMRVKYLVLLILFMAGYYKMFQRFRAFRNKGYGEMSGNFQSWRQFKVLKRAKEIIRDRKIDNLNIFTNKYKLIGIDFGYSQLQKAPNIGYWTDKGYRAPNQFNLVDFYKNNIVGKNGILIYMLDDFEEVICDYKEHLSSQIVLEKFEDGFLVYSTWNMH